MSAMDMKTRWRGLLRVLKPERPPDDMRLYVRPSRSSADEICNAFLADPTARHKFLLVGARGGGKSTALRAVASGLAGHATLVTIDLDASGVSATAVSAFDLLYISGVALLARVADADERKALFADLARAYAGDEHDKLGSVQDALGGLVGFAAATEAVVKAAALASGGLVSTAIDVVNKGFRLLSGARDPEVIAETSPRGRTLQAACQSIARKARAAQTAPLCVLVDGLEKMNGQAGERFQQVFCHTRLLADAARMQPAHVDEGIERVGESLALGLTGEDFDILATVARRGVLPGRDRAARLFADGRILAHAPAPGHRRPGFSVHPLLVPDVQELDASALASGGREDEP